MTLLTVEDLWVRFGNADAVKGVSFNIDHGETVALVGESGSGKSVTALSVLQLLPYPMASHPRGSIRVDGRETLGAPKAELLALRGAKVSMIFQEPMTSLNPLHTIERQVGETLILHKGMSRTAARNRTLELLNMVRLPEAENRLSAYPHELSGGQRQRVMIAMALANEPELLIADEPTTALDVTIQARILNLLKELQDELGMALLLISHDLGVVRAMADRVCVMTEGEIVESGSRDDIFERPRHAYTRHLLASEPKGDPLPPRPEAPVIMQAEDLSVHYQVGKGWFGTKEQFTAVENLSFQVRSGETLGIVGESGSGKTTLGLALLRLLGSEGTIVFAGKPIHTLKSREAKPLRKDIQVVFQDPFGSLSPRLSVAQIIEEGLLVHEKDLDREARRVRVAEALAEVGLEPDHMDRYPHEFSGGQRQRISIARALVLRPKFVVLDEPTSALDMSVQAQIVDLLRDLQARLDLTYLFISHDLKVVRALATHLLVMRDGRVVEQGSARQVFENPQHEYTRELLSAAFVR
jgi:microcin C transport system ATP-binding protein